MGERGHEKLLFSISQDGLNINTSVSQPLHRSPGADVLREQC